MWNASNRICYLRNGMLHTRVRANVGGPSMLTIVPAGSVSTGAIGNHHDTWSWPDKTAKSEAIRMSNVIRSYCACNNGPFKTTNFIKQQPKIFLTYDVPSTLKGEVTSSDWPLDVTVTKNWLQIFNNWYAPLLDSSMGSIS